MIRWRGRPLEPREQVANARDSFVDLTPASTVPSDTTKTGWAALLPGQDIPLIWERRYGDEED